MPDMYHNMIVQVIACCGIVGMLALVYHFAQVLNMLIRRVTAERLFYFGTFLMLVGTAMFENHIFHIVPALLYSLNLLLWERDAEAETPLSFAKNRRGLFVFGK